MQGLDVAFDVTKLSRRRWLSISALAGLASLCSTPERQVAAGELAYPQSPTFGRAKRCLLLFLTGGPPQHDTWDPKPNAPSTIRGELSPIRTSAPGVMISELFPKLAAMANRFRIVRSLTHADTVHTSAGYAMLTGARHPLANQVSSATMIHPSPNDRPHLASLIHGFHSERRSQLPPIAIPEIIKDAAVNEFPGLNSGFLSNRFDPLLVEANAERTGFRPPATALPVDVPFDRLQSRMTLRSNLELPALRSAAENFESLYRSAIDLMKSDRLQRAFQLDRETPSIHEAYGSHLFGQGALLARRLLEADARFVTVYWHYEGPDDSPVWDTHWNNFKHLRGRLAPPTDQAVSALLADLQQRGLLDETLVLCLGEFGRSPKINSKAGREHWPQVASALVAGAGVPGGTIVGSSDADGAYPADRPVTPEDWGTTLLHWLGVDPRHEMQDQLGRPHRAGLGDVCPWLFG